MIKNNLKVLLIVSIGLMAIISGCTGGQDVTSAFKALPEVQQFMAEHPNAKITVTYWSKDDVMKSSQEISQQCDKPITPIAMYKATISEGDLKVVSWINAENQIVICSSTQGSGVSQTINPTPNPIQTQTSTSNIIVDKVIGDRADTSGNFIQTLLIRIKTDAGSIDLRRVILSVSDRDNKYELKYVTVANDPTYVYSAIAVRDEDKSFTTNTPIINSGDLIELTVSSTALGQITLPTKKTFLLSLKQEPGSAENFEITTPNSFGMNRYVYLYP